MFHQKVKYTLMLLLMLFALSGCNQRVITVNSGRTIPSSSQRVYPRPLPPIREEILIKKNPTLGERVTSHVPKKNPKKSPVTPHRPQASTPPSTQQQQGHGHDANLDGAIDRAEMNAQRHDTVMERMPFPVEEYARLRKRGYSTVLGTVYLENLNSGEKIMGEKVKIWLNPVTSYSNQWYEKDYLGGYKLTKIDRRIFNYMKLEYSKSDGKFSFSGVPKGEYYLVGSVKCTKACGLSDNRKNIRLVKRISVGSGVTHVDLMKNVP